MKYRLQVCLDKGKSTERWVDVHPVGMPPYEYDTRDEAEHMLRLCYDASPFHVRINEVL